MRHKKYSKVLVFVVSEKTREVIDRIAEEQEFTIGEVARSLLDDGLKTRGLA